MAVAAPTAVTRPPRSRSISVQVASVAAGASSVLVNASAAVGARRQRAAGVEAEPAEPQQAGAEHRERHVVRQDRVPPVILARADDHRGDQRRRRGVDVHDRAAGEVERAHRRQEPAAPDPVRDRRVDRAAPTAR